MKISELLAFVDELKPNSFSTSTKITWLNEVEGMVWCDVMLLSPLEFIEHEYNEITGEGDDELLVIAPHNKLYYVYLFGMIDFAYGEYDKYQNSITLFNSHFNDYARWYALNYRPADGGFRYMGEYITAYGIAVKHGFEGSEEEWLGSLRGTVDEEMARGFIEDYLDKNPIPAPVQSVNGKRGDVNLNANDVGALPVSTKIPAKTSDIANDSGFITNAVADLLNYYTKDQTLSKEEINAKISAIPKFTISVVSSLPTSNISETTIYLVGGGTSGDLYTEYIYVNGKWEILGSQRVDLTGYATETWVNTQLSLYLKSSELDAAISTALDAAKASGEFDGADGKSAYQYAKDGGYTGTEEEFAAKLAEEVPTKLPNPEALTINGVEYDGSKAVDITITGGGASDNILLGQTPVTLSEDATIKLVGTGEHTYTVKGKTVADLSTVEISTTSATIEETEDYIEMVGLGDTAFYSSFVTLIVKGLEVGVSYDLIINGMGLDMSNGISNGYYVIRDSNNSQLAASAVDDAVGIAPTTFTATTANIEVRCYPASAYWFKEGYRTARIRDIYINKTADGTQRTDVINKTDNFTDSYSLGRLSKGITITSDPSCEVYAISGGASGEAKLPLEGKTVVCFGDSLFGMYTGDTSAPAYVAEQTGATVHNVGFGGCRMSVHPTTGYAEFCMWALAKAINEGDWSAQDSAASKGSGNFPDQLAGLKAVDFNEVDYVVIHYGTNDFTSSIPLDNANKTDYNTLCGALRYSVEKLLATNPKLEIYVSLPCFRYWDDNGTVTYSDEKKNGLGLTLIDYIKALAETAKEYNLPIIDSYYGLGINKHNATTFLGDGVHHNIEGRKRFGEYIGAKLVSKGDTSLSGADVAETSGGASIDVTATVGQTIVVKEVDENGKPTSWESADYQPRTHWEDATVIFPETTVEIDPNEGMAMILADVDVKSGDICTIKYNGIEYADCEAVATGDGQFGFGNLGAMAEGLPVTEHPFIVACGDGFDEDGNPIRAVMIAPLDGAESVTLSIIKNDVTPIPSKYLTEVGTYYVDITEEDNTYTTTLTPNQFAELMKSGRSVVARTERVYSGTTFYSFIPLTGVTSNNVYEYWQIWFNGVDYTGVNKKQFIFMLDVSSDDYLNAPYVQLND